MIRHTVQLAAFVLALAEPDMLAAKATACEAEPCLTEVLRLSDLPVGVSVALGQPILGLKGIADRGEEFNLTDVVDSELPMRRFIIGGVEDSRAVVAIEHGGRGHYFTAYLFIRSGSTWTQTNDWSLDSKPESLPDLLVLIDEDLGATC